MDPKLAKLALKAISYGVDKIPDNVFDAIPGHKAKDKDRIKRSARNTFEDYGSDSDSDGGHSRHSKPKSRDRRRRHSVDTGHHRQHQASHREPRHYDPRDYAEPPGIIHEGYYKSSSGHETGSRAYPQQYRYNDPEDQYSDMAYSTSHSNSRNYPQSHYTQDSSYTQPSSRSKGRTSAQTRNVRRSRSASYGRARSKSRIRSALDEHVNTSEKGLGAGAAGAVAGGLLGHQMGHGSLSTIAGAVIGGIGANMLENRRESSGSGKGRNRLDRSRSHSRRYNSDDSD